MLRLSAGREKTTFDLSPLRTNEAQNQPENVSNWRHAPNHWHAHHPEHQARHEFGIELFVRGFWQPLSAVEMLFQAPMVIRLSLSFDPRSTAIFDQNLMTSPPVVR